MGIPKKRKKNRKRKTTVIIVFLLAVLLLAAAILAFQYAAKRKKQLTSRVGDGKTASMKNDDAITYKGTRYIYNDHLSNFLFMGIDRREKAETEVGQADAGQADAVFMISWDRVEHKLTLISIPRDTMTEIEVFGPTGRSFGMSKDHLSLAYAFGDGGTKSCELMKEAVSNLLCGIPIQGYCAINMDAISLLTDAVGGVTVVVPDDSLEEKYPEFQEGAEVVLDGENTEIFVRHRDTNESQSALTRQKRQNVFLKAYAAKVTDLISQDSSFITELYTKLDPYMVTNIGNDIFIKMGEDAASGGTGETFTVPGEGVEGKSFDEYHIDEDALNDMVMEIFYKEAV